MGSVVCLLAAAVAGACPAEAECIHYEDYLHRVCQVATPGEALGVAISGIRAYVADGSGGLLVIDLTDLESPQTVGGVSTTGSAWAVVVEADYAYVADGDSGLQVIDIGDPQNPEIVGHVDTPGLARGIAVSGAYAFVADDDSGLQVIDITDPENPQIAGSADTPGNAQRLAVSGDHVYVADGGSGLQVVDIADPQNPQIVGSVVPPGGANDVAVSGDYAYATSNGSGPGYGFQVIDIVDPTQPEVVGNLGTGNTTWGLAVAGTHAYVRTWGSGLDTYKRSLTVIDVANPQDPVRVGSVYTPGSDQPTPWAVTISGSHVYVADNDQGLQVIDASHHAPPEILGDILGGDISSIEVAVGEPHVYATVRGADTYFFAVDVLDPSNPEIVSSTLLSSSSEDGIGGLAVSSTHAYVAGYFEAEPEPFLLKVIDITSPEAPLILGSGSTQDFARGVALSSTHAYVAASGAGLQVIDITDPESPQNVGAAQTPGRAWGIALSATHAYVADRDHGLQAIDVTDPTDPQIVGSADLPGGAWHVKISGSHAYVAGGNSGLHVLDITDPQNPQTVSSLETPGFAQEVAISGPVAYVAIGGGGLFVIDVTTPEDPEILGGVTTDGDIVGVAVSSTHAYMANLPQAIQIVPLQCVPVPIATVTDLQAFPMEEGVSLSWHGGFDPELFEVFVYRRAIGESWECLTAAPLTGGPDFEFVDSTVEPGECYEYEIELLAGDGRRERFGPVTCELRLSHALLLDIRPIVTSGAVQIGLSLPRSSDVELSLHDPAGRRLGSVDWRALPAGRQVLDLDLSRVVGARAAAGLYFIRLEFAQERVCRRILLTR